MKSGRDACRDGREDWRPASRAHACSREADEGACVGSTGSAWVGSLRIPPPFALENEPERGMHGSAICSFTLERAMPGVA